MLWAAPCYMKTPALVLLLLANAAVGSVVLLPEIRTTGTGPAVAPRLTNITSQTERVVNLDNRTDLTPGVPVKVTVVFDAHFIWSNTFKYDAGRLELSSTVVLRLMIGAETSETGSTFYADYGVVPGSDTSVSGTLLGPELPCMSMVVPWSADLSQARLELSQSSSITGTNAYLLLSTVSVGCFENGPRFAAVLESIPEPGAVSLLGVVAGGWLGRRRRCGKGQDASRGWAGGMRPMC